MSDDHTQNYGTAGSDQNREQLPPMGWYSDPAGSGLERYWDGSQWTRNTRQPPAQPPVGHGEARSFQGPARQQSEQPQTFVPRRDAQGRPVYDHRTEAGFGYPQGPVTDDGVRLAGWWSRAFALVLDYLVITLLQAILLQIWGGSLVDAIVQWQNDVTSALGSGDMSNVPMSPADPQYGASGAWYAYSAAVLVIQFVYATLFMRFKGATLGQMVFGLRVVHAGRGREAYGLDWRTSLMRNGLWLVFRAFSLFPATSMLSSLAILVDGIWPIFHKRRQALHDLVAKTQVISIRP